MSFQEAIAQFITLLVVLDPAATVPMFLMTVEGLTRAQARRVAVIAATIAFLVLLFFIVFFELLLEAMRIPLSSFQLAGSIVWLIYGCTWSLIESRWTIHLIRLKAWFQGRSTRSRFPVSPVRERC
jgi:multiple antibiotic resistance protein